jgi:hypothetical protein
MLERDLNNFRLTKMVLQIVMTKHYVITGLSKTGKEKGRRLKKERKKRVNEAQKNIVGVENITERKR